MNHLIECNFEGLVGPGHHFGGLGVGNLASRAHAGSVSHPRAAALQGLDKIAAVARLGDPDRVRCAVLPPHYRPDVAWLRSIGFGGPLEDVLKRAAENAPHLLAAAWSASSMWTANAATVTPSVDTADHRVQLTVSNLISSSHRQLEPPQTLADLRAVFSDADRFVVNRWLSPSWDFRDEGAANHMRLGRPEGGPGLHLFVSGSSAGTHRFPSRQGPEAFPAIVRRHDIDPQRVLMLEQHPQAIDLGAFHNDVVATSCDDVLMLHAQAFVDTADRLDEISDRFDAMVGRPPEIVQVGADELSLDDTVSSYLFNSQLIPDRDGTLTLISPMQCREDAAVASLIDKIVDRSERISAAHFVELRESMANGGGPACLRMRVPLTEEEVAHTHGRVWWDDQLEHELRDMIESGYRSEVSAADQQDGEFAREAWEVTTRLRQLLQLPCRAAH